MHRYNRLKLKGYHKIVLNSISPAPLGAQCIWGEPPPLALLQAPLGAPYGDEKLQFGTPNGVGRIGERAYSNKRNTGPGLTRKFDHINAQRGCFQQAINRKLLLGKGLVHFRTPHSALCNP